jgi:hypothetical protein
MNVDIVEEQSGNIQYCVQKLSPEVEVHAFPLKFKNYSILNGPKTHEELPQDVLNEAVCVFPRAALLSKKEGANIVSLNLVKTQKPDELASRLNQAYRYVHINTMNSIKVLPADPADIIPRIESYFLQLNGVASVVFQGKRYTRSKSNNPQDGTRQKTTATNSSHKSEVKDPCLINIRRMDGGIINREVFDKIIKAICEKFCPAAESSSRYWGIAGTFKAPDIDTAKKLHLLVVNKEYACWSAGLEM